MVKDQWYVVNSAPYAVGGPVSNRGVQLAVEATYWPTSLIWFPTQQAAETWAKSKGGGASAGIPGTGGINTGLNAGANAGQNFYSLLTGGAFWTRIGEVAAGIILLYVGLKAVTTPQGQEVSHQTVKNVAKRIFK